MSEKLEIVVITENGAKIPLDIYSRNFTWRDLILPPIKSIIVRQGHHAAEIGEYTQFNFMLEVTQQTVGFGTADVSFGPIEPRKFWIMGNVDKRVDLYIFECYKGAIISFARDTQAWGSEFDGASTSGWKLGETKKDSIIQ